VRFIHTADWQIGMTRHFLDADAQARFADAREGAIRRIGQLAQTTAAAFVVVAGDVFETNLLRPRTVQRALDAMRDIPVPVYLLPGNHDPLGPTSIYQSSVFRSGKPSHVEVLDSEEPVATPHGVQLVGVPWTAKRLIQDRVGQRARLLPPASSQLRVLVGHGATDAMGAADSLAVIDVETVEAAIAGGRLHYVALGDHHSTKSVGQTGRIWYAGAPEPTDYDEVDAGNVLVVDLTVDGVQVAPVPVGTWHFVERTLEVGVGQAAELLDHWLAALPDKAHTVVKVNFRGTISLRDQMELEATLAQHSEVFGAIDRHAHRDELAVLPAFGMWDDIGLAGYGREVLDQLIAGASAADSEGQRCRDALALYYRLIKEA